MNDENDEKTKDETKSDDDRGLLTEENPAGGLPQSEFSHDDRNPDADRLGDVEEDEEDDE